MPKLNLLLLFFLVSVCKTFAQATRAEASTPADTLAVDEEVINFLVQTRKGNLLVNAGFGMGMGFRNDNLVITNSTALVDYSLNLRCGLFVSNRWLAGAGYQHYTSLAAFDYQNEYRFSFSAYTLLGRYYWRSGIFGEATAGLGNGRERFVTDQQEQLVSFNGHYYSMGMGIGNFWFKKFNFELMVRYHRAVTSYESVPENLQMSGLGISGGIAFVLE